MTKENEGDVRDMLFRELEFLEPLLDDQPYLHQNALAFRDNKQRFDHHGKTFTFKNTKTTNYRVYCRQVLQQEFRALSNQDQERVDQLFESFGGLEALHADGVIASGIADHFALPYA